MYRDNQKLWKRKTTYIERYVFRYSDRHETHKLFRPIYLISDLISYYVKHFLLCNCNHKVPKSINIMSSSYSIVFLFLLCISIYLTDYTHENLGIALVGITNQPVSMVL